jgi:hypothetical protein
MGSDNLVYEILPSEFKGRGSQRGYDFRMLERSGDVCLFEKSDEDGKYYEVIVIRKRKGGKYVIGGKDVEFMPKESYPSDEEFGDMGWCYVMECDAKVKYDEVRSRVKTSLEPANRF